MSKKLYEETNIQDIADAIREKNGSQNTYTVAQMGDAVRAIHADPVLESLSVTENGNYLPSAGKDGFSSVSVDVEGGAVIQPLSVTQNGTYNPPSGIDGYSPVMVNVSGGGGSEPSLPAEYKEVEYLTTNGTAYITPSLVLNADTLIHAKAKRNSASVQTLIGNRTNSTTRWDAGYENSGWVASNECRFAFSDVSQDPIAEFLISIGNLTSTGFRYGAYLYSTLYPFDGDLYKLRIYFPAGFSPNSYILAGLYYPCRRIADDVLGFYDAVNNVFYQNEGSGSFVAGPDVN